MGKEDFHMVVIIPDDGPNDDARMRCETHYFGDCSPERMLTYLYTAWALHSTSVTIPMYSQSWY